MSIVITLSTLPDGGVFVHSNHRPRVGEPVSPAQCLAMDLLNYVPRGYVTFAGDRTEMPQAVADAYAQRSD